MLKNLTACLLAFALALPMAAAVRASERGGTDIGPARADVLFRGGTVFDGSGDEPYVADVGVRGGRIVFIGDADEAGFNAGGDIDAAGLWVTPGFIDAHSHALLDEDYGRDAMPYLRQGITTVVLGVDGSGSAAVAERFAFWRENGIGVNGMLFVGHGAARKAAMGMENRAPRADEMAAMKTYVRGAMEEGAFGLSTGLFYVPGTYASTEEVIEVSRVAAEWEGAIYDTHDRDLGAVFKGVGYDASVQEAIRIGEESGLRVIFSHYNLQGTHNYGRADIGARYVNDARERGVEVSAAHHPYTATMSNLRSYTLPNWAAAGGVEAIASRFDDPETLAVIEAETQEMLRIRGGPEKLLFTDPDPELNGKTLAEVAEAWGIPASEASRRILRSGNTWVMNLELYDAANTRRLAQEPWMMTCTDGRTPRPDQPIAHPRTFGAFPMKLRLYTKDEALLAPEFVIRSFSGLAADFFKLPDRGYLREGYVADVVVLDPERYWDRATFENPRLMAEGVVHLLVNGSFAIHAGESTGTLAGTPIPRPF